ncbi:tetratricopeptide repeat protein [candidate division KSB1 bacterium]|nr:tetratricopeptide repeat protein [candidate division KSB1 bacterium]
MTGSFLYIFLTVAVSITPEMADQYFHQGNQFYQSQEYESAIESYSKAAEAGFESPALYYNLGNAYFKTNQIGMSVLFYERAKRLAPRDPDILFNLQIVQLYVVDKIELPPMFFAFEWWNRFKAMFSTQQVAGVALTLYILFMVAVAVRFLLRRESFRVFSRIFIVPLLILTVISAIIFFVRLHEDRHLVEGVILAEKVDVKSSPAVDATDVFALHEGSKVRIYESSGEFFRIELPNGNVGWIPEETFVKI